MAYNFIPYDQDQLYLLPPSTPEWVCEGSLARFVSEVVEQLDGQGKLSAFSTGYREDGWGRAGCHPRVLVKVLLYGYCRGVIHSRRIGRAWETDIAFRYLLAIQQPDFRTVSAFRKNRLTALEALFIDVLQLCRSVGMAKTARVALDGRKRPPPRLWIGTGTRRRSRRKCGAS